MSIPATTPWKVTTIRNKPENRTAHVRDANGNIVCTFHRQQSKRYGETRLRFLATFIAYAPELAASLAAVLEWAKGNRGARDGNPYLIPEVKTALQTLAESLSITEPDRHLHVSTEKVAKGLPFIDLPSNPPAETPDRAPERKPRG